MHNPVIQSYAIHHHCSYHAPPPPHLFSMQSSSLQNQHLISIPSTHPPLHQTTENIRLSKCHKCFCTIRNSRWSYSHQTINSRTKIRDMGDD